MALNSYLKVKGQKQGEIKGDSIQKGREGWILVIAYHHEIAVPRDAASGMATGRRQHKPFVITKELDQSSIPFYNALVNNEMLATVELKCFAPNKMAAAGVGTEVNHYNVILTNAQISSISSEMLNNKNPDLLKYEKFETISFVYEKIEWVWTAGNKTAQDSL